MASPKSLLRSPPSLSSGANVGNPPQLDQIQPSLHLLDLQLAHCAKEDSAMDLERWRLPTVNTGTVCRLQYHRLVQTRGAICNSRVRYPMLMQMPASFHTSQRSAAVVYEQTGTSGSRTTR